MAEGVLFLLQEVFCVPLISGGGGGNLVGEVQSRGCPMESPQWAGGGFEGVFRSEIGGRSRTVPPVRFEVPAGARPEHWAARSAVG